MSIRTSSQLTHWPFFTGRSVAGDPGRKNAGHVSWQNRGQSCDGAPAPGRNWQNPPMPTFVPHLLGWIAALLITLCLGGLWSLLTLMAGTELPWFAVVVGLGVLPASLFLRPGRRSARLVGLPLRCVDAAGGLQSAGAQIVEFTEAGGDDLGDGFAVGDESGGHGAVSPWDVDVCCCAGWRFRPGAASR